MCLESFIYDYAAHNLSDIYVKKYLDKLGLKSKWLIIPRLVTGKDFPTDSKAFQGLQKLIEERNKLVHYKSRPEPSDEEFDKLVQKLKNKSETWQKLIKERNELVNHKSQLKKSDEDRLKKVMNKINKMQDSKHIVSPYETVVEILTELKRLDCNTENNTWWQLEDID
jgi:mevalonate kinase